MINCPNHKKPMLRRLTQHGPMHICTFNNCDMMKWGDGPETSPADSDTRQRRHVTHGIFDKLWRDGHMTRNQAYGLLAEHLGLDERRSHIGLFDIIRCNETISFAERMQKKILLENFGCQKTNTTT